MFCEHCKIDFRPNERALWCRNYNCTITTQREPTPEQRARLGMETRWRGRRDEDENN